MEKAKSDVDKVSDVMATLLSGIFPFQPNFSAKSNSCIVAPQVIGSHIKNFNISINTKDEQCHNNNNEEQKQETEHLLIEESQRSLKSYLKKNYSYLHEGAINESEEGLLRMLPVIKAAQIVDLSACGLSLCSCDLLSSALSSSMIQELDLSLKPITDAGLQSLCKGLALSKVHTLRLRSCGLTEAGAESLSSLLSSSHCELKSLDLSDNDCGDRGVQILSQGLSSARCPLQVLNLSLCRVSERGCMFLASALNRSDLKELDLSFNHPGESGVQLLTALKDDPLCSLHQLSVEKCGEPRIGPGPMKYLVSLSLDPDTAHKDLSLSNQNLSAIRELNPPAPSSSDRFGFWTQVLCTRGFTGRCYFEVEFCGRVCVGVASKHMSRQGEGPESRLGQNPRSWGLNCNKDGYKAVHNGLVTPVPGPLHSSRLGVFLDFCEGKLSFFSVREGELKHIFTFFKSNFTEPLYPAFHLAFIGASIHLR
uniref:B30.2/SPRY domain-containing protein n=1 Tax=Knipowitschia caucasica TaxID=637954 RepID=A0AAV2LBM5_KNICA